MKYAGALILCYLVSLTCLFSTAAAFDLEHKGRLQKVHRDGDASPTINLKEIQGPSGLYAIGPLAGLRGEITVLDGVAYISRVEDGAIKVSHGFDVEAPFLVYGNVTSWKAVPLPDTVHTIPELEQWLPDAAKEAGIDPETEAFPFKITTSGSDIGYHVINNTDPGYIIKRPHDELKVTFTSNSEPSTLIGVFSKLHAGVFTHHGQWTHIHVVGDDGKYAGHLDSIELGPDAVLYLPGN